MRTEAGNIGEYSWSYTIVRDTTKPYFTGAFPADGSVNPNDTSSGIHVKDDESGVDVDTIKMTVGGLVVTPEITGDKHDYLVTYTPPEPYLFGATVPIHVEAEDIGNVGD